MVCRVEKIKNNEEIAKVWFYDADDKERVWRFKEKWEEEEIVKVENWLPIKERIMRHKLMEDLKEAARKAGVEASIILKEKTKESKGGREAEDQEGQNWRIREWRGERARENRRRLGTEGD